MFDNIDLKIIERQLNLSEEERIELELDQYFDSIFNINFV